MVARTSPADRQPADFLGTPLVSEQICRRLGVWPRSCRSATAGRRAVPRHSKREAPRCWAGFGRPRLPQPSSRGRRPLLPPKPQGTIKIGVLHSLSGTMAISETTLKDTILMMVDDVNKKGGLLGKQVAGGRRRSSFELAAFCRKGARLVVERKSCSGIWFLDIGVAQIGAAGIRGAQRLVLLSGTI